MVTINISQIEQMLAQRVLVLDGAIGTRLLSLGLSEADFRGKRYADHPVDLYGNLDVLSLTCPELIQSVHRAYLEAGADIISTNTFNAGSLSQERYRTDDDVYQMNLAAARIARRVADAHSDAAQPRLVAGIIGPTDCCCSIAPEGGSLRQVSPFDLRCSGSEQARALVDGGVDLLLIETVYDLAVAKETLGAICELEKKLKRPIPRWVSATISHETGRLLSGETAVEFYDAVAEFEPFCIGLNCGTGPETLHGPLMELAEAAKCAVSIHPSAGIPDESGQYPYAAEQMTRIVTGYVEQGLVNIAGGCCGTTSDYTRALSRAVARLQPRPLA